MSVSLRALNHEKFSVLCLQILLIENSCDFRAFRIKLVFSTRSKPWNKVLVGFTACSWKKVKGQSMIPWQ